MIIDDDDPPKARGGHDPADTTACIPAVGATGTPHPFVILFLARSGSTAIYGNLRQHPRVIMRAEVFGARSLPGGAEQTDDNRVRFLRKYWAPFRARPVRDTLPWKGFKWQLDEGYTQFSRPRRLLQECRTHGAKLIVLRRRNVVRQVLSGMDGRRRKAVTGSAHIPVGTQPVDLGPLNVDIDQLRIRLRRLQAMRNRLDTLASEYEDRIEVDYEDYEDDPITVLRRIVDFVGLPEDEAVYRPAYRKITSGRIADLVSDYARLEAALRGTEFEPMLR